MLPSPIGLSQAGYIVRHPGFQEVGLTRDAEYSLIAQTIEGTFKAVIPVIFMKLNVLITCGTVLVPRLVHRAKLFGTEARPDLICFPRLDFLQ